MLEEGLGHRAHEVVLAILRQVDPPLPAVPTLHQVVSRQAVGVLAARLHHVEVLEDVIEVDEVVVVLDDRRLAVVGGEHEAHLLQGPLPGPQGLQDVPDELPGPEQVVELGLGPLVVRDVVVLVQVEQDHVGGAALQQVPDHAGGPLVGGLDLLDLPPNPELVGARVARPGDHVGEVVLLGAQQRLVALPVDEHLLQEVGVELLFVPAPVDQEVRGCRGDAHVVQALVEGEHLPAEVPLVQVEEEVGSHLGGLLDERQAGTLPVVDDPLLLPVVPALPRDPVPVGGLTGDERGGGAGRDRGEGRHRIPHVVSPVAQKGQGGGFPRPHGLLEGVGPQAVDHDVDDSAPGLHRSSFLPVRGAL
jgi:hypothetical protein